jgi:hypothetical protein
MRIYVIINADEVDSIDFDLILERNENFLSYSRDGSKALVKFIGDTPSFLEGKTQYTHSEILTVMATDEWSSDPNPLGE